MTDARGQSHVAQIITLGTTGGALTAGRNVSFFLPLSAFPASKRLVSQMLVQFANLAGCTSIALSLVSTGGAGWSTTFGVDGGISLACEDLPTSATAENLDLVSPWSGLPDAGSTSLSLNITATFRSGTTPAGTIALAQAGVWAEVVLP